MGPEGLCSSEGRKVPWLFLASGLLDPNWAQIGGRLGTPRQPLGRVWADKRGPKNPPKR